MKRQNLYIAMLLPVTAFLATYFAIAHGYFVLNWDGRIHLTRFENIYLALKDGHLPPLVTMLGFENVGQAFTSMYPWIGAMLLILPRFLFENPILALAVGIFMVNLVTAINCYVLVRELTSNIHVRFLGIIIYIFSTYHLILLYTRVALGEALAYVFLPLVLTGAIRIWNGKYNYSWLILGIGMGMLVNSHLISTAIMVIMIICTEFIRIFSKKINFKEVICFIKAGVLSAFVGCYSLVNILYVEANNNLAEMWKGLGTFPAKVMWDTALSNAIQEDGAGFSMGIVSLSLLVILTYQVLKNNKTKSAIYVYSSVFLFCIIVGWIPISYLNDTFFANIQFLGRLLSVISLFLVIALMIQCEENKDRLRKTSPMFVSIIIVFIGISAVNNWHENHSKIDTRPGMVELTRQNYEQYTIYREFRVPDYLPKKVESNIAEGKVLNLDLKEQKYNFLSGVVKASRRGVYTLGFSVYKGVPYTFKVNGRIVKNLGTSGELKLRLISGENRVTILTKTPMFCYITFLISIMSLILAGCYLACVSIKKFILGIHKE